MHVWLLLKKMSDGIEKPFKLGLAVEATGILKLRRPSRLGYLPELDLVVIGGTVTSLLSLLGMMEQHMYV